MFTYDMYWKNDAKTVSGAFILRDLKFYLDVQRFTSSKHQGEAAFELEMQALVDALNTQHSIAAATERYLKS